MGAASAIAVAAGLGVIQQATRFEFDPQLRRTGSLAGAKKCAGPQGAAFMIGGVCPEDGTAKEGDAGGPIERGIRKLCGVSEGELAQAGIDAAAASQGVPDGGAKASQACERFADVIGALADGAEFVRDLFTTAEGRERRRRRRKRRRCRRLKRRCGRGNKRACRRAERNDC